jgi:hypothetical protein
MIGSMRRLSMAVWRIRKSIIGVAIFLCVTFLFTMYLSSDYMIGSM